MQPINRMRTEFLSKSRMNPLPEWLRPRSRPRRPSSRFSDIHPYPAVTNAIIHGYGDEEGIVVLNVFVSDLIEITVEDSGEGIEDVEQARAPLLPPS